LSKSVRRIAAAVGHLLVWCCVATAQQGDAPPAPKVQEPARPPVASRAEEVRPGVYYLPDKQGNLQPVLDFKYQDFVDLYKLKNQLERRDEPPRYTLQRMTAIGSAGEEYAQLDVQFQLLVRDDGWVRVPLRLDQGVLHGDVKYKGSGEHFLCYESDGDGYVAWVRGKNDSQHEIAMTIFVPLATVGDRPRLKLSAPRTTASELKLTVSLADAVGKVSEGATLLPPAKAANGGTELSIVGLGGDFLLAWHKTNPRTIDAPQVLEASGAVLTRLDSRSIAAEATLSVRSYGAPFDRFVVQLPPDAELVSGTSNGFTATSLDGDPNQKGQRGRVMVRLPKKTAGPVDVRLACRRAYDPAKDRAWCELAGFEVVGAARQWGTLAVAAAGDWQVLWGASNGLRETDQLPDSTRKEEVVAGFEYSAQPYSLTARLTPRKPRVGVDPRHVLQIERNEVRLESWFTYTIRGAKIATLDLAIPGWELDEVGPDRLVAVDGVTVNGDRIAIPLVQPTAGTLELHLRAHRTLDTKAKAFSVPLPRPGANAVDAASVVVLAADNVELIPNHRAIEGLVRQRVAPPQQRERLPERQQDPFYYRATNNAAVFAADFRVHTQRITVDVATQATLRQRTAEVEQRQSYAIAYEPIDRLTIAVPRILAGAKQIQAVCDGKPVTLAAETEDLVGDDPAAPISMRAALPSPRIGTCEFVLQYSVPLTEPTPDRPSTLAVPIPVPEDGQLITNSLTVREARNTRASIRKPSEWVVADREPSASGARSGLRLTSSKSLHRAELDLRWQTDDDVGTAIVDRAWVQSWFNSTERQDRAAYQLTTNRKEVEVQLPAGTAADEAVVMVDGKRVDGRLVSENQLLIPLPGPREERRFVIELLYHFPDPRPPQGELSLEFPRLGPNVWVRRTYWQLVLPTNEHMIANPEGFTGEFNWGWRGYFWGRLPLLDQEQLESWTGAAPRPPLPDRVNVYLFSALGNVDAAELITAGRTWIVLGASGAALILGLLLIYVPVSRHPATLLVLGVALLAAGLIAPEPTLLVAQAASLGLALTLLAGLLERGVAGRRRRTAIRKEPSSSRINVELGSTQTPFRAPAFNGPASTETMPAVQPPSPGNVEP
jgi:hypothetical protein